MQMRRFARDCSFVRSYVVRSPARALIGFAFAQNDSLVSGFRSGGGCVFASVFVSRFGAEKRSQFRGLVQTAVVRKRFTAVGARFQFWAREAVPFWGVFLGPVLVPKRGPSFGSVQAAVLRKWFTAVGARSLFWAREAVPFWACFWVPFWYRSAVPVSGSVQAAVVRKWFAAVGARLPFYARETVPFSVPQAALPAPRQ